MLKYFLKTSFRKTIRNRNYSLLNLIGLSLGMAICLLIFIYIQHELSYDHGWSQKEKICRISHTSVTAGKEEKYALCGFGVGPELYNNFPEVVGFARILNDNTDKIIRYQDRVIEQNKMNFVDTSFLDIFDYPLLYGSRKGILDDPRSIVISENTYRKLFPDTLNPVGETLKINDHNYTVNGVFLAPEKPTHLELEIMGSINILSDSLAREYYDTWVWLRTYTYLLFDKPESIDGFETKITSWQERVVDPWIKKHQHNTHIYYTLQAVTEIHKIPDLPFSMGKSINPKHLKVLALVGLFILLIACVNYINLSTAFAIERAREVGINKVLGADRRQMLGNFLLESVFIASLAFIFALIITEVCLPVMNQLTDNSIRLFLDVISLKNPWFLIFCLALISITGLLSGLVPAIIMSRFSPSEVLKGNSASILVNQKNGNALFRKILIVFQFIISLSLIICTLIVWKQMNFVKNHDPGFEHQNIVIMNARFEKNQHSRLQSLRQELLQHPDISAASASRDYPGYDQGSLLFYWKEDNEDKQKSINLCIVDEHYDDLLKFDLLQGRFFEGTEAERKGAIVINQAAARAIGWKEPLGKDLRSYYAPEAKVIGVVNNYNYASLQNPVEPLAMLYMPGASRKLGLRIQTGDLSRVIEYITDSWEKVSDGLPLDYTLLDNKMKQQYKAEEEIFTLLNIGAVLALLLCGVGLLGLSSYETRSRTREIGIRKILGAGKPEIIINLIKEFFINMGIASMIAMPLSWYVMQSWLEGYAYHIQPGAGIYLASLVLISVFTLFTITGQALRAVKMNVAEAIKFE